MTSTLRWFWLLPVLLVACGSAGIRAREGLPSRGPRAEGPTEIRIRRVLVAYEGAQGAGAGITRTRELAEERATMLAGMARDTQQSFRELIVTYGDTPPDIDDRSTLRLIVRGQADLSEVEQEAAFALDVGQVSRPVETTAGFVVIVREPDPTEEEQGPAQIGARHILISFRGATRASPSVTRTRDEAQALAARVAASAREEGADWVALHQEYSDEPDSPRGGDLGVFPRGEMVRAFDRAAFSLEIGQVSDPVESEFGFHVIERTR